MDTQSSYDICSGLDQFSIIGVNYQKADTATRGAFAITEESYQQVVDLARQKGLKDLIVLSTCNRTELYGITSPNSLMEILCEVTQNPVSYFKKHGYVLSGMEAVQHLFKVAAGLDSQIIGDYEILMQLKLAARAARENKLLGSLLDRLVNFALQSSKRIKTETKLSSGTVSVAFAAIEVIREKMPDAHDRNILLVGAGKFGQNVARNINEYFPGANICITNRTFEIAESFAATHNMQCAPYESLPTLVNEADVLIVSTASEEYTVVPQFFSTGKQRLVLDLSVPGNVDPAVEKIEGLNLMDVDEISAILDTTLAMRQGEIPKATAILNETIGEFVEWHKMFLHRHFLLAVKSKLYELSQEQQPVLSQAPSAANEITEARIQKAVNFLALDLRSRTAKGCQYINTLSHYLQTN